MKRSFSKKLLCLCMVAVLAASLAIPTFAVNDQIVNNGTYSFFGAQSLTHLLNVYGNGSLNNNVTLYSPTNQNDQRWIFKATNRPGTLSYYIATALAPSLGLNINHSNNNCNIYTYTNNLTGGKSDSSIDIIQGDVLRLAEQTAYRLDFDSLSVNANVYWSSVGRAWGWRNLY